ncbi:MAG: hypothetical protein CR986_03090 [Ignavibacteriae bacterium]|nr:MAG: hypothetical protein CR986_03090 [Ignavibacteriota bacterium]
MKMFLKMAWRNIWRNKKRTLLTLFSIFIAIFLALFTRSMQTGFYNSMISNAVKLSTGYIQIHGKGFWDDKTINKSLTPSKKLDSLITTNKNITTSIKRVESFCLASSGNYTKGTLIFGIETKKENELNHYSNRIIKGEYLENDDNSILIAEKLAEYLKTDVNDTLVLLGQGYHGITAANQFLIKGIIKFPIPQLNNQLVFIPLKASQNFFGLDDKLTSVSIMLKEADKLNETTNELRSSLSDNYEIMQWQEMNKDIVQAIESDRIGGIIMLGILYLVIGFGVFGTIMMMTMERKKEFAVMVAIGMKKRKIMFMVLLETLSIGFVAIITGLLVSYPVLLYLHYNPIPLTGDMAASMEAFGIEPAMPFALNPSLFFEQIFNVILITIFAILYPLSVTLKFNVMKALRS